MVQISCQNFVKEHSNTSVKTSPVGFLQTKVYRYIYALRLVVQVVCRQDEWTFTPFFHKGPTFVGFFKANFKIISIILSDGKKLKNCCK
jgi:hypothetical protein